MANKRLLLLLLLSTLGQGRCLCVREVRDRRSRKRSLYFNNNISRRHANLVTIAVRRCSGFLRACEQRQYRPAEPAGSLYQALILIFRPKDLYSILYSFHAYMNYSDRFQAFLYSTRAYLLFFGAHQQYTKYQPCIHVFQII